MIALKVCHLVQNKELYKLYQNLDLLLEFVFHLKRILQPNTNEISQAIASGLTDLDLVFIEEAFERLLLDYDRLFPFILFLE